MDSECILEIDVTCLPAYAVKGHTMDVVMIPFTGEAHGPYFTGRVLGTGCDTQKYGKDGRGRLSARYMLEGRDAAGAECRVFIENEGEGEWHPKLVTDSECLKAWEETPLRATVEPAENGVTVRIFRDR